MIGSTPVFFFAISDNAALVTDELLGAFFIWFLPIVVPIAALSLAVYFMISLPLRRQERARFFLDVIESALAQGEQIEQRIISLARSQDRAPGVQFHLLAAHLEQGHTLISGLKKVPRLLPPQVEAMLRVGETIGDIKRVLPACKKLLRDGISQSRAAINYQVVIAFVINPLAILIIPFLATKIMPVFSEILASQKMTLPELGIFSIKIYPVIFFVEMALALGLYFCALVFLGGPRFINWIESGLWPTSDFIFLRVPWRRKRLQRDFSAMLALLLDAGVPEERAVLLAAESTANKVFMRRAEKVVEKLCAGVKLTEAIRLLDDTGEFRWRLENAAHYSSNFFRALKGWQESLDAKAFQLEQAAAQTITTALVLLNGFTVVMVAATVFQCLARTHSIGWK